MKTVSALQRIRKVFKMKANVVAVTLLGVCCLGFPMTAVSARSLYPVSRSISCASKKGWFKKVCPDCDGTGGCSTWYGGWEPCERCGGIYEMKYAKM